MEATKQRIQTCLDAKDLTTAFHEALISTNVDVVRICTASRRMHTCLGLPSYAIRPPAQVIWLCKSVDTADIFIEEETGTPRVLSPELLLCLLQASACVVWPRAANRHRHYCQQHDVTYRASNNPAHTPTPNSNWPRTSTPTAT